MLISTYACACIHAYIRIPVTTSLSIPYLHSPIPLSYIYIYIYVYTHLFQQYLFTLEASHNTLKSDHAILETAYYNKQQELINIQTDIKLLQYELTQKNIENNNIKLALDTIENEKNNNKYHIQDALNKAQHKWEQEKLIEIQQLQTMSTQKIENLLEQYTKLQQNLDDEILLKKQLTINMNVEKQKFQKSIEHIIIQMQNSTKDVIDRTLISNLIVSYFQRNR